MVADSSPETASLAATTSASPLPSHPPAEKLPRPPDGIAVEQSSLSSLKGGPDAAALALTNPPSTILSKSLAESTTACLFGAGRQHQITEVKASHSLPPGTTTVAVDGINNRHSNDGGEQQSKKKDDHENSAAAMVSCTSDTRIDISSNDVGSAFGLDQGSSGPLTAEGGAPGLVDPLSCSAASPALKASPLPAPQKDDLTRVAALTVKASGGAGIPAAAEGRGRTRGRRRTRRRRRFEDGILSGDDDGSRDSSVESLPVSAEDPTEKGSTVIKGGRLAEKKATPVAAAASSDDLPESKKRKVKSGGPRLRVVVGGERISDDCNDDKENELTTDEEKGKKQMEGTGKLQHDPPLPLEAHHMPSPWSSRLNLGMRGTEESVAAAATSATYDTPSHPRWRAHQLAEDYISLASAVTLPPTHLGPFDYAPSAGRYPVEQATALGYLTSPLRRPTVVEKWNPYEIALFEAALALHGKAFHRVRGWVGTKTTKEIVEFYYVWKKTSHGQRWKDGCVEEAGSGDDEEGGGGMPRGPSAREKEAVGSKKETGGVGDT